jgi:hypothetical protein
MDARVVIWFLTRLLWTYFLCCCVRPHSCLVLLRVCASSGPLEWCEHSRIGKTLLLSSTTTQEAVLQSVEVHVLSTLTRPSSNCQHVLVVVLTFGSVSLRVLFCAKQCGFMGVHTLGRFSWFRQ